MEKEHASKSSECSDASDSRTEFSWGLRFVSSHLDALSRRVYIGATFFFIAVFVAELWPVHAYFSRIRPFVFGLPFSLFYLAILLIATFSTLLAVFAWEGRRGRRSGREEEER